jgi:hypothetical protein
MLAALRERGLSIPEGSTIRRTYAGRIQRAEGAWSWHVLEPPGSRPEWLGIGSQFPLSELFRRGFELDRDPYGQVHLDPRGTPPA